MIEVTPDQCLPGWTEPAILSPVDCTESVALSSGDFSLSGTSFFWTCSPTPIRLQKESVLFRIGQGVEVIRHSEGNLPLK